MKAKTKFDDLWFGIVVENFNKSVEGKDFLETVNLFDIYRVKRSVAMWVISNDEFKKEHNFLSWCFGDVWGRAEFEFMVCPWGGLDNEDKVVEVGMKVDAFQMYVKPNEDLLRQLVDSVSMSSAQKYLREDRKRKRARL